MVKTGSSRRRIGGHLPDATDTLWRSMKSAGGSQWEKQPNANAGRASSLSSLVPSEHRANKVLFVQEALNQYAQEMHGHEKNGEVRKELMPRSSASPPHCGSEDPPLRRLSSRRVLVRMMNPVLLKAKEKWYGRLPPPIEGGGVSRSCPRRRSPLVLEGPPACGAVDNWTLGIRQAEGGGRDPHGP